MLTECPLKRSRVLVPQNNIDGFLSVSGMGYLVAVRLETLLEHLGIDWIVLH